jgi:hypothetical protein
MFDALSFTEIDEQHVELLPARTVMSLFDMTGGKGGSCNQTNRDAGSANGALGVAVLDNINALNNISVVGNGLIPILSKGMC